MSWSLSDWTNAFAKLSPPGPVGARFVSGTFCPSSSSPPKPPTLSESDCNPELTSDAAVASPSGGSAACEELNPHEQRRHKRERQPGLAPQWLPLSHCPSPVSSELTAQQYDSRVALFRPRKQSPHDCQNDLPNPARHSQIGSVDDSRPESNSIAHAERAIFSA